MFLFLFLNPDVLIVVLLSDTYSFYHKWILTQHFAKFLVSFANHVFPLKFRFESTVYFITLLFLPECSLVIFSELLWNILLTVIIFHHSRCYYRVDKRYRLTTYILCHCNTVKAGKMRFFFIINAY